MEWLRWYNLLFLLPAAVAVLVLTVSAALGVGEDGDADSGDAGDLDVDGLDDGADADDVAPGAGRQLLSFFGVGRAPIMVVVASLMIGWGLFGLVANGVLTPVLRSPVVFIGPSLAIAAAGSLLTAKLFAELAARVMPKDETSAISQDELAGLTGKVIYPVSQTSGRVHVRDRFRTLHVRSARVTPGAALIPRGTEIIIASIDPVHRYVIVEPLGFQRDAASRH